MYDYISTKRDEAMQGRLMNLINETYDPTDPVQRRILDKVAPQFSQSRMSLIEKYLEQKEFIMKLSQCSHFEDDMNTVMGGSGSMSAGQKFQRAVRLLGGAEAFLTHPLDVSASGSGNGILSGLFDNRTRGLFSFSALTGDSLGVSLTSQNSATRSARESLAKNWLHLFPAVMMGKNNPYKGTKDAGIGAGRLVDLCEAVVNKDISTADFIEGVMKGPGMNQQGWI